MPEFDYIIIGAGSAGCVLANRLSADPSNRVALIEAGGADNHPVIHMPIGYGQSIYNPDLTWSLRSAPDPGVHDRQIILPRGRVLGGSSSVNGMIYIRGHCEDFNSWANMGATGWGWDDLLPYFKKAERLPAADPPDDLTGRDGPLHVEDVTEDNATHRAILEAFAEYGVAPTKDFNGPSQEGSGYYRVTMHKGRRWSTVSAYLKPARNRKNLTVITGAQVARVLFDGQSATGIALCRSGQSGAAENLTAGEVILSAGAYHSPHLLHLSGVGPAAHLNALGVPVIADNPAVGENLQDHYMAPLSFHLKPGHFSYYRELAGLKLVKNVLRYYLTHKGPMTLPAAPVGAFMKSHPALDRPDLQFHCLAVTGDLESASDKGETSLSDYPGITIGGAMLRPESRGHVRAVSPDPQTPPEIVHHYLTAEEDRRLAVRAMRIARELVHMPALRDVVSHETGPAAECETDDELLDFSRRLGTTMYHPVGSCRMGADSNAALDPQLRVRGVEGLRVIDASVMPRLVSGNTNAATIAVAEKAADMILQNRR